MQLKELTKLEFKEYADKCEQISFHQTYQWGELKEENGWHMQLLGLMDNDEIKAATLILSKPLILKKKMFYAPRGFLIDYNDLELLTTFTKEIKKYVNSRKGIFIKIDPYLEYQERDLLGNIVNNGINNKKAYNNLLSLGYKHFGFNVYQEALQPRWIFITKTKDISLEQIMANMDNKTRQILRKNERLGITTREIAYDELDKFKDIMQHTGDRRDFIDRPLSYYQKMYKHLAPDNILKILVAELDCDSAINNIETEIKEIIIDKETREKSYLKNPEKMNKNKYEQKQQECISNIKRIEKNKSEIEELKTKYGSKVLLGGILFLLYGGEVLSLVGGSYEEFMKFQSAYTVHFAGLKYALTNNYKRYNFYGITGDFNEKNNPLFGLYSFKRDFGGQVVELIGEFDLIINKTFFIIYKIAFKTYKIIKKLKHK